VQVVTVACGQLDDGSAIFKQAFRHAHPVAEIAGEFQVWESPQNFTSHPRVAEATHAMGLVRDHNPELLLQFQRGTVEIFCLRQRPTVGAAVGIDEKWPMLQAIFDLLLHRFQMLAHCAPGIELPAENLGDPSPAGVLQESQQRGAIR